jgi:hypothetical protein
MAKTMTNEGEDGDDGIWMNAENQNAFEPLTNNNCFHVDIQEQGHHEMNEVLEKNEYLMQKQHATLKKKWEEGMAIKLLHIRSCSRMDLCFVMCVVT